VSPVDPRRVLELARSRQKLKKLESGTQMSSVIADTTKLDPDINEMYRDYHQRYCCWRNSSAPLVTTLETVPTFEQFVQAQRQEHNRSRLQTGSKNGPHSDRVE
jgi:hypothetical protein